MKPNNFILSSIYSVHHDTDSHNLQKPARTELDSHANMAVVGKNCFVFENTGLTCDVLACAPDLPITIFPIFDSFILYNCLYNLQSYLLMIRNEIYVDKMNHN